MIFNIIINVLNNNINSLPSNFKAVYNFQKGFEEHSSVMDFPKSGMIFLKLQ